MADTPDRHRPVRIVCTHGLGDRAGTWDAQRPVLARYGDVVVWDLPGHGDAERLSAGRYRPEVALDVLADMVGDGPAVLVGHSLGGYLSLETVRRHPGAVVAMVLVSTGPGYRDPANRDAWNASLRSVAAGFDMDPAAVGLGMQRDGDLLDALPAMTLPVCNVVGGRDRQFHAGHAYMGRKLPDVTQVVLDGAGHHPHRSNPEEFNAVLASFLDRTVGAAGTRYRVTDLGICE